MEKKNFYIIDSCSLIDLHRSVPMDIFKGFWKKLEELVNQGMLISHIQVFHEISKQDDELADWLKNHKKMFYNVTPKQAEIVTVILKKYPSFVKVDNQFDADPWLIALAKELQEDPQKNLMLDIKRLIVTEETLRGNKIKIPFVCQEFGIECINRFEMMREEGWEF